MQLDNAYVHVCTNVKQTALAITLESINYACILLTFLNLDYKNFFWQIPVGN